MSWQTSRMSSTWSVERDVIGWMLAWLALRLVCSPWVLGRVIWNLYLIFWFLKLASWIWASYIIEIWNFWNSEFVDICGWRIKFMKRKKFKSLISMNKYFFMGCAYLLKAGLSPVFIRVLGLDDFLFNTGKMKWWLEKWKMKNKESENWAETDTGLQG